MSAAAGTAAISGWSPTVVHHNQRNPGTGRNAKRPQDHLLEFVYKIWTLTLHDSLSYPFAKVPKYREGSSSCRDVHTGCGLFSRQ